MAGMNRWWSIAWKLGMRMEAHAYCANHLTEYVGCPFCKDRAVFQEWAAMANYVPEDDSRWPTIAIQDLPRNKKE